MQRHYLHTVRVQCLLIILALLGLFSTFNLAHAQPTTARITEFLPTLVASDYFETATHIQQRQSDQRIIDVFHNTDQLGILYLTSDYVNTRGYSSKPIDIIVGLDTSGTIVAAKMVEHHEPIVLIGIPEKSVIAFIEGYIGHNFLKNPPQRGDRPPVDIISGATVTLMVVGDSITRSSIAVNRQSGLDTHSSLAILAAKNTAALPSINRNLDTLYSWEQLVESGAITRLHLSIDDARNAFPEYLHNTTDPLFSETAPHQTFIDLYVAMVSVPAIGRSLLGELEWRYFSKELAENQEALLIAANGPYSFKGSGYVRGGIFDRIEIIQNENSFRFRDYEHQRLARVEAEGAPPLKEIGIFKIPQNIVWQPTAEFRLQLLVQRILSVHEKSFSTFDLNYRLPDLFLAPPTLGTTINPSSIHDSLVHEALDQDDHTPIWKIIWQSKTLEIITVLIAVLMLGAVFFFQNSLAKRPVLYERFRITFLLFTLLWIGWYSNSQLSIVNVLTFTSAIRGDFQWEFFLMDPIVFILWSATAISALFWNRGAFCGWLCPFGALQELLNRVAKFFRIPQLKIPYKAHERLSAIKYIIFIFIFSISLYDLALAEVLSEIEPFKTSIILKFIRDYPFVIFSIALLILGLFIERFYCRYLCPLGAALAIPAKLRIFNWLKRYNDCGNPCQRCAVECPVQAIAPEGDINPNECIQCLHCQMLYHHSQRCPHLLQKAAKRRRGKPSPIAPPPTVVPRNSQTESL